MMMIFLKENELFEVVICCFCCVIEKNGLIVELCECQFYEKLIVVCKCKKVVVVKCLYKCLCSQMLLKKFY